MILFKCQSVFSAIQLWLFYLDVFCYIKLSYNIHIKKRAVWKWNICGKLLEMRHTGCRKHSVKSLRWFYCATLLMLWLVGTKAVLVLTYWILGVLNQIFDAAYTKVSFYRELRRCVTPGRSYPCCWICVSVEKRGSSSRPFTNRTTSGRKDYFIFRCHRYTYNKGPVKLQYKEMIESF